MLTGRAADLTVATGMICHRRRPFQKFIANRNLSELTRPLGRVNERFGKLFAVAVMGLVKCNNVAVCRQSIEADIETEAVFVREGRTNARPNIVFPLTFFDGVEGVISIVCSFLGHFSLLY